MKIALLDKDVKHADGLKQWILDELQDAKIKHFVTSFSLVTYLYDDVNGDLDLLCLHITSEEDELIMLAKDIQHYFQHIRVIFYSENTDCAENIFMAEPSYFLKVPIYNQALKHALYKVNNSVNDDLRQTLTVNSYGKVHRIRYSSILYLESIGRKMIIYSKDNTVEITSNIADILQSLPNYFHQCHRSYIVNTEKICQYNGNEIMLTDNLWIPVSRAHQKEFRTYLISEKN